MSQKTKRRPHHKAAAHKTTTASPARPSYDDFTETVIEALDLLTGRLAYAARRGDVPGWVLYRTWAEVVLFWSYDR